MDWLEARLAGASPAHQDLERRHSSWSARIFASEIVKLVVPLLCFRAYSTKIIQKNTHGA